jgi:hypothetical protein
MKPSFFGRRALSQVGGHKIGATGKYPLGKVSHDDEGELKIAMAADHENQVVRIEFGKEIAWLALPRDQALQLAEMIRSKASQLISSD